MANTYLSATEYINRITGLSTTALVGNVMHSGSIALGATSLTGFTPVLTVALNQYDNITIFDGANSEVVTVASGGASIGASTIPISATQYAHVAGTSMCSDGTSGTSLAAAILEASAELENICRYPLLQASITNEQWPLVSSRAWIDNNSQLGIRPRQFPVQSVSAISLLFSPTTTMTLDATQAGLNAAQRLITVGTIKTVGGNGNTFPLSGGITNTMEGRVQLSYVAGYTYNALPLAIKRACTLLVSDILSDVFNPTGAASIQMGKRKVDQFLRGDLSGESALVKRARRWLSPYTDNAL